MSDDVDGLTALAASEGGDVARAALATGAGVEPLDDMDDMEECDDEPWEDDMDRFDCGLDDEGQCSLAGTEDCDFECPWRDSEDFCGSAAWYRKRGEIPPWERDPSPKATAPSQESSASASDSIPQPPSDVSRP